MLGGGKLVFSPPQALESSRKEKREGPQDERRREEGKRAIGGRGAPSDDVGRAPNCRGTVAGEPRLVARASEAAGGACARLTTSEKEIQLHR